MPHTEDPALVPWWTPSWSDSVKHLGWRWIFAVPAIVILGIMVTSLLTRNYLLPLWMLGAKVVMILLAIPVLLLLELWRSAISSRKEPFCIHCGYGLQGLPDHHRCPECGRPYSFAVINEYRRDPHWFKQRHKMLGHLPEADAPFHAGPASSPRSDDGT